MLVEAIRENNEIKIINFPKNKFKGSHWKLNIESIEEINDNSFKDLLKETAGILTENNNNN